MEMSVLWYMAPCILVEVDRRFRGAYYLRHQGDLIFVGIEHLALTWCVCPNRSPVMTLYCTLVYRPVYEVGLPIVGLNKHMVIS
jgi:hypothetical protein